jgi:hypothetical protein
MKRNEGVADLIEQTGREEAEFIAVVLGTFLRSRPVLAALFESGPMFVMPEVCVGGGALLFDLDSQSCH